MTIIELLEKSSDAVVSNATNIMTRARIKNYENEGNDSIRRKLIVLYDLTLRGVKEKNLIPMVSYVEKMAEERFNSGFGLGEVQTALNVLEEAIWKQITKLMSPAEQAEALGLISSILGSGKDILARTYVSLAGKSRRGALKEAGVLA
jgi:hypothetical protein